MKKFLGMGLTLVVLLSIYACSKKDKDDISVFYGDWKLISSRNVYDLNGNIYEDETELYTTGETTLTFGKDLKFSLINSTDPTFELWNGNYDLKGHKLLMTSVDGISVGRDTFAYQFSGTNLSLKETWVTATDSGIDKHEFSFLLERK